ncbi:hypothetical protein [Crenothrix polyspora]|uniref:DUF4878 domain-containing protein n=1 Tax=Crenothrix polyspora TaxID=360316 RepID=A0A1R4HGX3_9GAMM|nr:hypothetical protein [Crenothrix polyspora]SJM95482.1 conserved exported hypothetical protein [Crenothrix polyspora]
MATIKSSVVRVTSLISLIRLAGVVFLLAACQASVETAPDKVAAAFWQAVIAGNLPAAQNQATKDSQASLMADQGRKYAAVQVGAMTLDGDSATVVTLLTQNDKKVSFNTALLKQDDGWKVDYQQTRMNISMLPFQSIVNELQNIGESFGEQLQQQMPLIEKGLESFGDQLKRQLEDLNQSLEKSHAAKKTN